MILKRVHVKNFRSLRDATVDFGKQTAILGTNGAGKSTILRAIQKFYGQSTTVDPDDFFSRDLKNEIQIALTFCSFSDDERELFESRIHNNEMTVARIFDATNSRGNGRYYGMTMQCCEFVDIRKSDTATIKRERYNVLRQSCPEFSDLQNWRSSEQAEQAMIEWETAHLEQLQLARDDGQFFGFTNVAKGTLQKSTSFVFIPAVRDVIADAVDAKGAVVAQLMELVVRSAIQKKIDIQKFQAEASAKFRELTSPSNLPELGLLSDNLTQTLQLFYSDAGVGLKWRPTEDLSIPLPVSDVMLREDGFEGPVDRKGHGLQRAFIFTLLQHLAHASGVGRDAARNDIQENDEEKQEIKLDAQSTERRHSLLPGLILAIEEPELYQHPTKQRHFAKVLTRISDGQLPGVATQTQVIFASHSSLFVSINRFDEIRLARRRGVEGADCKECCILSSSIEKIAKRMDDGSQVDSGTNTVEGVLARLQVVNSEVAEGFFADAVVLVEGPSDRAAVQAAAVLQNYDPEEFGIAVLPVDGKDNLFKISLMFAELMVPVYIIWDCDYKDSLKIREKEDEASKNKKLQRISGCIEDNIQDFKTQVSSKYACFRSTLEMCIREDIGERLYLSLVDSAKEKFGLRNREGVQKSSPAMRYVISMAAKEGKHCKNLLKIVEAIKQLRLNN